MQETYSNTVLPWPDIKCASKIGKGGICKYKIKAGCGLSDEWLIDHVMPAITEFFGNNVATILSKPLLWACLDEESSSMVPDTIKIRILNALHHESEQINLQPDENIVKKVLFVAS